MDQKSIMLLLTIIIIVAVPVWLNRDLLWSWWRGQTYRDYLEDEHERLMVAVDEADRPPSREQIKKRTRLAWCGFVSGALPIIGGAFGDVSVPVQFVGFVSVVLNGAILMLPAAKG